MEKKRLKGELSQKKRSKAKSKISEAKLSDLVFEAIRHEDLKKLKNLFSKYELDVNGLTLGNESSLLHMAASHGLLEMVKFLVAQGANVNVKDCARRTPLDLAKLAGFRKVVDYLVSKGARANISNEAVERAQGMASAFLKGGRAIRFK